MLLSHLDGRKHKERLVGLDKKGRHVGKLSTKLNVSKGRLLSGGSLNAEYQLSPIISRNLPFP